MYCREDDKEGVCSKHTSCCHHGGLSRYRLSEIIAPTLWLVGYTPAVEIQFGVIESQKVTDSLSVTGSRCATWRSGGERASSWKTVRVCGGDKKSEVV